MRDREDHQLKSDSPRKQFQTGTHLTEKKLKIQQVRN